jgi:heat shock protein HtpX
MAGKANDFWALEHANRRRAALLVAAQVLIFAALGLGFDLVFSTIGFAAGRLSGFPYFTATGLIFGVTQSMRSYYGGPGMVLGSVGAFPLSGDEPNNKVLIDVTHEMALAARLPEPRLYMIDDSAPNSFAVGRSFNDSVICVTRGLVDRMDREQLQAVIGHEMAHIRSYDMRLTMLVTVAMLGGVGSFSQMVFETFTRGMAAVLSREREFLADAAAVEFTRNPTGLIRALCKIAETETPLRRASLATAPLFFVDPFESAGGSYAELIGELTRIRSQAGESEAEREAEAEAEATRFANAQYRRDLSQQQPESSHPPLAQRIARLQRLVGTDPSEEASPESQRKEIPRSLDSQTRSG